MSRAQYRFRTASSMLRYYVNQVHILKKGDVRDDLNNRFINIA